MQLHISLCYFIHGCSREGSERFQNPHKTSGTTLICWKRKGMEGFCSVEVPRGEYLSLPYYREKTGHNADERARCLASPVLLCCALAGNHSCQTSAAIHFFKERENEVDHSKEYPCNLCYNNSFYVCLHFYICISLWIII